MGLPKRRLNSFVYSQKYGGEDNVRKSAEWPLKPKQRTNLLQARKHFYNLDFLSEFSYVSDAN